MTAGGPFDRAVLCCSGVAPKLEAKNGRAPQQALAEHSLHDCTQKQLHTIAFREKLEGEVGSGSDAYKFENR